MHSEVYNERLRENKSARHFKNDVNIETLRINIKKKLQKFSLRDTVNETIDETNFPRKLIYNEAVKIKNFMKKK